MKTVKIFGDKYKIRRTFDVVDYIDGITSYEVCDENDMFLLQYDCEKLSDLVKFLKWKFYKTYEDA